MRWLVQSMKRRRLRVVERVALASSSDSPTFISHHRSWSTRHIGSRNWSGTLRRWRRSSPQRSSGICTERQELPTRQDPRRQGRQPDTKTPTAGWRTKGRPLILSRAGGFGMLLQRCLLTGNAALAALLAARTSSGSAPASLLRLGADEFTTLIRELLQMYVCLLF